MTVYEYASDMNKTIEEILNLCQKLGINVSSKDDELSDDDVINLDYAMNLRLIGNFLGKKTLFFVFITFIFVSASLTVGEFSAKNQTAFCEVVVYSGQKQYIYSYIANQEVFEENQEIMLHYLYSLSVK